MAVKFFLIWIQNLFNHVNVKILDLTKFEFFFALSNFKSMVFSNLLLFLWRILNYLSNHISGIDSWVIIQKFLLVFQDLFFLFHYTRLFLLYILADFIIVNLVNFYLEVGFTLFNFNGFGLIQSLLVKTLKFMFVFCKEHSQWLFVQFWFFIIPLRLVFSGILVLEFVCEQLSVSDHHLLVVGHYCLQIYTSVISVLTVNLPNNFWLLLLRGSM